MARISAPAQPVDLRWIAPQQHRCQRPVHHGLLRFRARIRFAQAHQAAIGVDADPQPLDGAGMHGDAAPQVDRFNSRDQHTIEGISLLIVIAVVAVLALLILWALIVQRR
jgi:hypothetical protein